MFVVLAVLIWLLAVPVMGAEERAGIGPLQFSTLPQFSSALSSGIHFLDDAASIEAFLASLDREPPDWTSVYGQGHHDPGHDDRLFALNRERDASRAGSPALASKVAFRWSGELSRFDPEVQGFSVALGPVVTATRWGDVRFKPEDLPGELKAIPPAGILNRLRQQIEAGKSIELAVLLIGGLLPEESIIYDFSHDQEGRGLIMPVVLIEQMHYVILP